MDERKEYWIKLFIKKCLSLKSHEQQVDVFIEWCSKTYDASEDQKLKLKKKYAVDDYINKLIPIIDKYFTIKDLKESIKFYSHGAGKKLLDYNLLQDVGKVEKDTAMDIEKDFAIGHKRQNGIKQ
jgi:hypothetical protein